VVDVVVVDRWFHRRRRRGDGPGRCGSIRRCRVEVVVVVVVVIAVRCRCRDGGLCPGLLHLGAVVEVVVGE
jgi:hypothetical protein